MTNLLGYLEETIKTHADKTAFAGENGSMTFGSIYEQARRIGSFLAEKEVRRKPVIVYMQKSPEEITAFLGVLYAGGYYVPVDKEMPEERRKNIFRMMPDAWCICEKDTKETGHVLEYQRLCRAEEKPGLLTAIREQHVDTDPAYTVFTSGSTGVPKGVVANHRSVIDYIEQLSEILHISGDTVFGNQAPFYVDACLKEIYPTLKYGAKTVLIPRKKFRFPVELVNFLNEQKINTICWVTPALTMISALNTFEAVKPGYLRTIAFGSEVFQTAQFRIWAENVPAEYINLYGPTECTGMSAYYRVSREIREDEVIPIGRAFPNTGIFLLGEKENGEYLISPENEEEQGEIIIRGTCVTMGYYADQEKSSTVFVQNPLQKHYPEMVYRTGDIGRYQNGELVFVSRKDNQIKHMGHRIELGEIETVTGRIENVFSCACIYSEKDRKIVLYYTGLLQPGELKKKLKEKLPSYMLPSGIYRLEELPLTLNGKTDRKRLKELY
ncbi:MAG: AMP-binding protein [Candidatus Gastranaerophilaceae bacterium]|nr:aMP-dependent synthetase and ligase [Roseburia sp. CAG:303]